MANSYNPLKIESRKSRCRGLTLIESLVVLSLFVALAALSFSVLGRVQKRGRLAVCQSNEHQIFLAIQAYLGDYDRHFPSILNWSEALGPYVKSAAVFQCPEVPRDKDDGADAQYAIYPRRINAVSMLTSQHRGASDVAVSDASHWMILMDGDKDHGDSSVPVKEYPADCAVHISGSAHYFRPCPEIHDGGGNYLFLDGHVKWMPPQEAIQTDCEAGQLFPTKF